MHYKHVHINMTQSGTYITTLLSGSAAVNAARTADNFSAAVAIVAGLLACLQAVLTIDKLLKERRAKKSDTLTKQ
jgi:hypothetical protein